MKESVGKYSKKLNINNRSDINLLTSKIMRAYIFSVSYRDWELNLLSTRGWNKRVLILPDTY